MKRASEQVERRKHRRYIVRGRTRFLIDSLEVWADLVNFGQGGMLIRTPFALPVGTRLDLHIFPCRYPTRVDGIGQVVGGRGNLLAIQFLENPPEAGQLLRWLEVEHCLWTGTFDDPDVEMHHAELLHVESHPVGLHPVELDQPAWTAGSRSGAREGDRVEKIEEEIFQQA